MISAENPLTRFNITWKLHEKNDSLAFRFQTLRKYREKSAYFQIRNVKKWLKRNSD